MYYFLRDLCRVITWFIFRVKITGKENLPQNGAFVVVGNHISIYDPIILSFITPRPIHFMAKAELYRTKFTRWLFESVKTIKVERGTNDISAIKKSLNVLKNGQILGIFPEGTRTNGKKEDSSAKSGAVLLAHRARVNIVPVAISSNYKLFSRVNVRIMPVFNPVEYLESGMDYDEVSTILLDKIYEGVDIN